MRDVSRKRQILTDETVHVRGVARIVWNGEVAITDGYLTLAEGQCEETEFIEQTAHCLKEKKSPSHYTVIIQYNSLE